MKIKIASVEIKGESSLKGVLRLGAGGGGLAGVAKGRSMLTHLPSQHCLGF